tara:strand:- start:699 stop:2291 length:1593 start_codon:yes stop_codon:yes gene_type:complete
MANITIVKLKVRRGSDNQRKQITLDQGEVGYTLDTRRLFVGDGTTLGGRVIGNTSIGPFSDITNLGPANSPGLQVGDIGYANSKLYRLTSFNYDDALSGYAYIGNLPDNSTIEFGTEAPNENKLIVKKNPGALNASHFDSSFFGDGLLSAGNILKPSLNANYFFLSGDDITHQTKVITPGVGSITQREIWWDAIGQNFGLSGGNQNDISDGKGTILSVKINRDQFTFDPTGVIQFKSLGHGTSIPISSWAGGGTPEVIPSQLAGGLSLNADGTLQADVQGVAGAGIALVNNNITLDDNLTQTSPLADGSGSELNYPVVENGLVTSLVTSIFDVVTGIGLSGSNVGDNVPIGAIIPHSRAFTGTLPAGYLLCSGGSYLKADYLELFAVIGNNYGDGNVPGDTFNVPSLTGGGMPGFLYGAGVLAPETGAIWVSGGNNETANSAVSGLGVNYIIKYRKDPLLNIFNGSPDQVTRGLVGAQSNQVYECINSTGANIQLSSGGFITFSLSGGVRNPNNSTGTYNKFAIPVFNYE